MDQIIPRCLMGWIIPPSQITEVEKRATRMQMRNLTMADGTVTFSAELEFSCLLSALGDSPSLPWFSTVW